VNGSHQSESSINDTQNGVSQNQPEATPAPAPSSTFSTLEILAGDENTEQILNNVRGQDITTEEGRRIINGHLQDAESNIQQINTLDPGNTNAQLRHYLDNSQRVCDEANNRLNEADDNGNV
jgi:hypothetical protein